MAALLNSFRMGFRTVAVSERSGEIWNTLMKTVSEFDRFQETIERTQKHLQLAQKDMDEIIGPRTRQIRKTLQEASRLEGREDIVIKSWQGEEE